jgi:hypothetical protein
MSCEVVFLSVEFFKMAAIAMETAKMLKNWKIDVIIIIIRNGAKTISLQTLFGRLNNYYQIVNIHTFYFDVCVFLRFLLLLLLRHPKRSRVTYCYSMFLFHYYYYYYYYSSTHFCPLYFSEMPWSNFMKPCRNIICHVKLCLATVSTLITN